VTVATPKFAQYLLRFDDLCPTMDHGRWLRFVPLLENFAIKPILAVVPDNQDPELNCSPPDPEFWEEMRKRQSSGATIGLHGFEHLCNSQGRSLLPLHARTEFAGAPRRYQRQWIEAGLRILRANGLNPTIWVAPRHGFDRKTLHCLRDEGICLISDGFAARPYRSCGVTWLPQQLWRPVERQTGLWTICIHSNTASDGAVAELERFLERFGRQFTSVERAAAEWPAHERCLADHLFSARMLLRIRVSRLRSRLMPG
jgi:hypothetical protein